MSNADPFKQLENRPVLASYASYGEAQFAVDKLSDNKFPVQNVAIVGVDLRLVEAVVARLSWGRAALSGLGMGIWFGLLLGLFVSIQLVQLLTKGLGPILDQPSKFPEGQSFFTFFFPALTAVVGFWATLSLNIPDFTRYAKSQKAQVEGQAGLAGVRDHDLRIERATDHLRLQREVEGFGGRPDRRAS